MTDQALGVCVRADPASPPQQTSPPTSSTATSPSTSSPTLDSTNNNGTQTEDASVQPPAPSKQHPITAAVPLLLPPPRSPTATGGSGAGRFICGVVEGFYGRPWTTEQRKDLFGKLQRCGMDSYVYAPKDDYKHRAYWRELYTVEEGDHLAGLIAAAKAHNVCFYYALSPGLDMVYSSTKEVTALKRKLEQVAQFGCEAFALLFDDIESEMTKADKEVFQTFAHAQVSVTNEIYQHLQCPRFLFCPTQYCSTRAVPTVSASDYLLTLGAKLRLDIDVLWTGPKVISKELTQEQLQEVTDVLRRPPVIWDNIHANDYDQKRVFLGPYAGRSPEIISMLRGVLTNPNCEFHANAIAIHTLAHWSRCRHDARRIAERLSAADMRMEREGSRDDDDDASGADAPAASATADGYEVDATGDEAADAYHPRVALRNAIRDWLPEFFVPKEAYGPITKPHPAAVTVVMPVLPIIPSVNTCMSLTTATTTTTTTASAAAAAADGTGSTATTMTATAATSTVVVPLKVAEVNTSQLQALAEVCSVVTGTDAIQLPTVVMNSLVSSTTIVTNTTLPHPIVSAGIELQLPGIPVPVSSIGIPIANVAGTAYQLRSDDEDEADEAAPAPRGQDEDMREAVETRRNGAQPDEPMDESGGVMSPQHLAKATGDQDVVMAENLSSAGSSASSSLMQVECSDGSPQSGDLPVESQTALRAHVAAAADCDDLAGADRLPINADDISLMCDLFYLPFEHGSRAMRLLNEFNWLKTNALVLVTEPYRRAAPLANGGAIEAARPEVQDWHQRAARFYALGRSVLVLAKKLAQCVNRELAYELFAYVWDIAGVVTLLTGFVKWLALGSFPANINTYTQGSYTWFSKGWRETFTSGDQEPWVFRGGLTADLQRLIPVDSGNDLFLYKLPDVPTTSFPTVRPYRPADEPQVNAICHRTCRDGSDCSDLFPAALQSIPADRLIGPFVTLTPDLCLVVVDAEAIVGYACAALDAKHFYRQQEVCWMPAMRAKYPLSLLDPAASAGEPPAPMTPAAMESIRHFHHFKYECAPEVLRTHPSMMTCCVLKELFIADQSTAKRLVTVLLAALRANGSSGVHACINRPDRFLHQFYSKLGFVELHEEPATGKVYMGRNF